MLKAWANLQHGKAESARGGGVTFASLEKLPVNGATNGTRLNYVALPDVDGPCGDVARKLYATFQAIPNERRAERSPFHASGELEKLLGLRVDHPTRGAAHAQCKTQAVCLERGTARESIAHHQQARYDPEEEEQSFADWLVDSCQSTELGFTSYASSEVHVYWLGAKGDRHVHVATLPPHQSSAAAVQAPPPPVRWVDTFLGHKFSLEDAETGANVGALRKYVVEHASVVVLPSSGGGGGGGGGKAGGGGDAAAAPRAAVNDAAVEQAIETHYDRSRAAVRTLTALGLGKGSVAAAAPAVWGSLRAYYNNNGGLGSWQHASGGTQALARPGGGSGGSGGGGGGLSENRWEAPPVLLQVPPSRLRRWHADLQPLVEEWAGIKLEPTMIGGIRIHEAGAWVAPRVEPASTAGASLAVHIHGTQGAQADWPLGIYDHADYLHEVPLSPGEGAFYESAKCLHGRFRGELKPGNTTTPTTPKQQQQQQQQQDTRVAELVVHYRPAGQDPQWHTKADPNSPAPVNAAYHQRRIDFDTAKAEAAAAEAAAAAPTGRDGGDGGEHGGEGAAALLPSTTRVVAAGSLAGTVVRTAPLPPQAEAQGKGVGEGGGGGGAAALIRAWRSGTTEVAGSCDAVAP